MVLQRRPKSNWALAEYSRGFLTGVKKSLRLKELSTAQRWLDGGMPHLLRIYKHWGITPDKLLGIEETLEPKKGVKKG